MQKKYLIIALVLFIVGYLGISAVRAQTVEPSPTPTISSISSDYFLKIDGIEGESKDKKHKDEIDILSFQWGESQGGAHQGEGGAGKVNMQDFHFVMKYNRASPKLFLSCASGEHFPKATLVVRRAEKDLQEYLKWTLTDVACSSYQTGGANPEAPLDQFSLNFSKIEVEYKPQKEDGTLGDSVKAGWNLKQNKQL